MENRNGTACSNALPKQNISSTMKNETGEAHWYPPPSPLLISRIYGESSQFSSFPPGFAFSSGYIPYLSCYPPSSCAETIPLELGQFYCSPHGSFALGTENSPNKLMREFCRFTATINEDSCNTCCKIAARHHATSTDEVSGIIFAFDPNTPPMHTYIKSSQSIFREKRASKTSEINAAKPSIKMRNAVNLALSPGPPSGLISTDGSVTSSSNDIPQCFCCAPIKSVRLF
ncbi:unnamed protein product [Onchocerca flexuosa]|uniref:DUF1908 domain-containing protein n=1 Tax=Onchocerca flexuosa TaxID=387005 RepID=A0A183H487_9BILA|nr:unnamed protein product [Onchocerca flexuosa]